MPRMPPASDIPPRALLFDLGGVLVDIDFDRALAAWARHSRLPLAQLRERFRFDEPYLRHETGALAADEYFDHLAQHLALDCDRATVQAGFNALLVGEIAETVQLLAAVRRRVSCYALSNTNAVHVAAIERVFPRLLPQFTRVFASHEVGHRKPDPAIFHHVLDALGLPAPAVLLFDDLAANVEAARGCGLQAVLVRGPADVRDALRERGLLQGA
jgi:putative hydrolase of the HAD superfamily